MHIPLVDVDSDLHMCVVSQSRMPHSPYAIVVVRALSPPFVDRQSPIFSYMLCMPIGDSDVVYVRLDRLVLIRAEYDRQDDVRRVVDRLK